jgi:hypothetical protein
MSKAVPTPTGTAPDLSPVTEEPPRIDVRGPARKYPSEVYLAVALEECAKVAKTLCQEEMARKGINGLLADPDRAGNLWLLWSLWEEMALALKAQLSGRNTKATVAFEQLELFSNSAGEEDNLGEEPRGPDA